MLLVFISSAYAIPVNTGSLTTGSELRIDITTNNLLDISGIQADFTFDSSILSFDRVEEGTVLNENSLVSTYFEITNNGSGFVDNIVILRLEEQGSNEVGVIMSSYFNAISSGNPNLDISELLLSNSTGNLINNNNVDIGFEIDTANAVPETTTTSTSSSGGSSGGGGGGGGGSGGIYFPNELDGSEEYSESNQVNDEVEKQVNEQITQNSLQNQETEEPNEMAAAAPFVASKTEFTRTSLQIIFFTVVFLLSFVLVLVGLIKMKSNAKKEAVEKIDVDQESNKKQKELADYIKQTSQMGYSKVKIEQKLISAGWKEELVKKQIDETISS